MIFHRAILLDEKYTLWGTPVSDAKDAKKQPFLPFTGRMILFFLPLIFVFVILILVLPVPSELENSMVVAVLMPLGLTSLIFPFWGALAGTMLPAAAIGGDSRFLIACKRGRKSYWRTVGRLFVGPILFSTLMVVAMIGIATQLSTVSGPDASVVTTLAIATIASTIGFFTPLLTATALSMAYQTAEAQAEPAA